MKRRKVLIIITIILLVIGVSFASWIITLNQTNNNLISSKCFNVTLSEENPISLTGAYPITDTEGGALTPFTFTITNTCNSNASYQVNLEMLNTTTLASSEVKVMLDNGTSALLSSKTVTTKTLDNATTAYILKTGYLDPNESVTYNLRLWIDESSTTEMSANKTFASKVTVSAGYKDSVTNIERCEAEYGEGAAVCNIIAQADSENSKCVQFAEDGSIIIPNNQSMSDYTHSMSDSDTPIICTAEDDYGTSYYLRGLHTNNNVNFAGFCWKIIRVTGTGGIKMIYNGDVDANGKCTTTSGEHEGFIGQTLSLSGNKLYGTSYTKEGSTYTLTDTETLNWPNDSSSIIGKYTCNSTSNTCSALYAVTGEYTSTQAYGVKLDQSTNYAQIGKTAFNYYTSSNTSTSSSPNLVGYMYNETYPNKNKKLSTIGATIISSNQANTSNYYYGDTISYSGGYYLITNQDNSDVVQLDWANNYESNLVGKYTCKGTSKYNDTTLRCSTAYKVIDTTTKANYMISEYLSGGRTSIGTIKLSNGYTDNGDGTYTLRDTITEKSAMEWYSGYSSYNNYYYCEDWNQTICSNLYKIESNSQMRLGYNVINVNAGNNYYYGSSFSYNENNARPYTLTDTVQFWDISDYANKTSINTHHYTCFRSEDNTCQELYFVYCPAGTTLYYIKLNGNETVSDALDKMLRNNNINVKDSHIKGVIDYWYKGNILGTEYESKLEDTIFCNDRTIGDLGGWSETGAPDSLSFNRGKSKYFLKCPNKRDAFTVSDTIKGNGALTYPAGLVTATEHILTGNWKENKTGENYWSSSPDNLSVHQLYGSIICSSGQTNCYDITSSLNGVRPSISLKPGTKFISGGDGSASNPYEVDMES